jgi:Ca2+-binding EF-hand superfamily protein
MHPEASTSNLLNVVEDILRHFDSDGDDQLTVEEFTNTFSSNAENKKLFLSDNLEERKAEFKKLIDKNHDGKVRILKINHVFNTTIGMLHATI